jgi:hypothetical protein
MTLRQWQLTPQDPYVLTIAADARLSATHYADDQVWELSPGSAGTTALAFSTRYGGRAGLAALVPIWTVDQRTISDYQAYSTPPLITAFTPNYVQVNAKIIPTLQLRAEYIVFESRAVGGRFTLKNTGTAAISVGLDLMGFVGIEGKERPLRLIPLPPEMGGGHALTLRVVGNLQPVVLLEGGRGEIEGVAHNGSRLHTTLELPPEGQLSVRWAHSGLRNATESLGLARHWLRQDWQALLKTIQTASGAMPHIETGHAAHDAVIAAGINQIVGAFLRPTSSLPHASFVTARHTGRGFSPREDGSDHIRGWSGQLPTLAYLLGLGTASIDPALAQGLVQNYLAVQQPDGWIDWKPGLAGQRQNLMCLPILARLAWGIFQYTEDDDFLRAVYPGLRAFFERWFAADLDRDGDGVPEWSADIQTGYGFMPTFAIGMPWAQNADITLAESPDLLAFLLSEALSLHEISYYLREPNDPALKARIGQLESHLSHFWHPESAHYRCRDRDTHATPEGISLIEDAPGDEEQFIAADLNPPNRVIIHMEGGYEHRPKATVLITGADAAGRSVEEVITTEQIIWTRGRGVCTTRTAFSRVDRLRVDGLIRNYRVSAATVDLTRLDLSGVLPLWAINIPNEHREPLIRLVLSERFLRHSGITMCASDDPAFDPSHEHGAGGVWVFWNTLIGESLIEQGRLEEAAEIALRLLNTQVEVLRSDKHFYEFYHADEAKGLGERGSTLGVVPLHLLLRVWGVRIINAERAWAGGAFHWPAPVRITQHGVTVERSASGSVVTFPSGTSFTLAADAPLQEVRDHVSLSRNFSPES